jgi:hypothetical protein
MSNNEGPLHQGRGFKTPGNFGQPKPAVAEDTLKSVEVQIERKSFIFTLKENPRGRFLRITEDVGGRRDRSRGVSKKHRGNSEGLGIHSGKRRKPVEPGTRLKAWAWPSLWAFSAWPF